MLCHTYVEPMPYTSSYRCYQCHCLVYASFCVQQCTLNLHVWYVIRVCIAYANSLPSIYSYSRSLNSPSLPDKTGSSGSLQYLSRASSSLSKSSITSSRFILRERYAILFMCYQLNFIGACNRLFTLYADLVETHNSKPTSSIIN